LPEDNYSILDKEDAINMKKIIGGDFYSIKNIKNFEKIIKKLKDKNIILPTRANDKSGDLSAAVGQYKKFLEKENIDNKNKIKEDFSSNLDNPKNQILYGPPGTGKTYSTVSLALDILGASDRKNDITSIGKLKEEFDSQVEFITFHQSFSYEDFVEGLKANSSGENITYSIEDGIFKKICESATNNTSSTNYSNFVKHVKKNKSLTLNTETGKKFKIEARNDSDFDLFTGSEFNKNGKLSKDSILQKENKVDRLSYSKAVYKHLLSNYQETTNKKPHILIIDEINRGNISQIFGELITLLEETKRTGQKEAITLQLPYSKEPFSVPDNLYIIGTMNTADRSLTMMDTALRRRFDFIEMLPNPCLLHLDKDLVEQTVKSYIGQDYSIQDWENINYWDLDKEDKENPNNYFHKDYINEDILIDKINLRRLLFSINERIEILYDREHLIGHSFLMNIDNLQSLRKAFKNKILPLLEEYFYDDFEKINLVLGGDNFYKKQTKKLGEFEKDIYIKQDIDGLKAEDFTSIYE
jgi:5-methylcytosine-specific restriction protein B